MSDKKETVAKTDKYGIFGKRHAALMVSNNSAKPCISSYRAKSKVDLNQKSTVSRAIRDKSATAIAKTSAAAVNQKRVTSVYSTSVTPDSRVTTTTPLSHKPGFIPAYLRNKTSTKNSVTAQIQSNKKQFIQIKKELTEFQSKAIECYKRYQESLSKLNNLNGQDDSTPAEVLQILEFNEKYDETTIPPIGPSNEIKFARYGSVNKLKQITGEKILSDISQQIYGMHVPSSKLLQEFSERLSLINNQMKLSGNSGGGDTNLLPAEIQSLFEEIEMKIVDEEKQKSARITSFMAKLEQVIINEERTPLIMKGGRDDLPNCRNNIEKVPNENKKKLHGRDKEFEKLVVKMKQTEMTNKRLEKQLEDRVLEVDTKDKSIVKFKVSIESMQQKLIKYSNKIQELETRITDDKYKNQLDWLKSKYDEDVKSLRFKLNELNLCIADDSREVRDENLKLKKDEKLLMMEIDCLKQSLKEMLQKKTLNKQSKTEENEFRRELERMEEELNRYKTTMYEKEGELNEREILLEQKNRKISELESLGKKSQEEILKLHRLNNQKSTKIEQLQCDLNKTESELRLQEESLIKQQQLLNIRSELIESLQENKMSVENRTYTVNQFNQHMASKPSELENQISTLTAKGSNGNRREEDIIKLLEETHEKMCVMQDRKIAFLENENAKLKCCVIELNIPIRCFTNQSINEIILRPCTNFYENLRRQKRKAATYIKVRKYRN